MVAPVLLDRLVCDGDAALVTRAFAALQWMVVELRLLDFVKVVYERLIATEDDLDDATKELLDLLKKFPMTTASAQIYSLVLENAPEFHAIATD